MSTFLVPFTGKHLSKPCALTNAMSGSYYRWCVATYWAGLLTASHLRLGENYRAVCPDMAVEFAVRKPGAARSALSASVNSTEVKKLMKYDGKALLVLFDFSDTPYTEEQIESFRSWPSLGRGNHRKSAFNVAYFFVEKRSPLTWKNHQKYPHPLTVTRMTDDETSMKGDYLK